ncbi:hypothetical protein GQX74_009212 [Glossina fuscipes]|nr:hypothetical protein GQX74_009212 [Glossina fuscipes]
MVYSSAKCEVKICREKARHEAKHVFLMTVKLCDKNIKPESIGIKSPFVKQVEDLRKLFIQGDVAMPKIGIVEDLQGQERDIILISGVRSSKEHIRDDMHQGLGFIRNGRSAKLAISRPGCLLMIYGNPDIFLLDPHWRMIIKYCVDNDAYFNDLPIIKARHEYRNEKEMFQKMFVTRKNLKIPKNLELKCEQAQSSKLWKALSTEQSAAEQWFTDKTFSGRCVKTFRQY